jgi:hypothetical protein
MLAERTAHGAPEKPVNEIQQALIGNLSPLSEMYTL